MKDLIMKFNVKPAFFILIVVSIFSVSCDKEDEQPIDPVVEPPVSSNVITDDINSNRTLVDLGDGIDYEICGSVDVNAMLTIEPGVVIVMCSGSKLTVGNEGALHAVGTEAKPIIIKGKVETAGYWNVLHINSNNPNNIFDYVTIADGGGDNYYNNSNVFVNNSNNAQLNISNSSFENSSGHGLYVENGASLPTFSSNRFSNNGNFGITIPISIAKSIDSASVYGDGNVNNYINVLGATVNQVQNIKPTDAPYLLNGQMKLNEGIEINPGVTFHMNTGATITVESTGYINAIGTSEEPIIIKGKVNSPGYWNVIHVKSNNPLNEFSYVEVQDGGGDNYYNNAIIFVNNNNNGSFTINNCTVNNSFGWGLYAEGGTLMSPGSAPEIESANTFFNNGQGSTSSCTGTCNVSFQ